MVFTRYFNNTIMYIHITMVKDIGLQCYTSIQNIFGHVWHVQKKIMVLNSVSSMLLLWYIRRIIITVVHVKKNMAL